MLNLDTIYHKYYVKTIIEVYTATKWFYMKQKK